MERPIQANVPVTLTEVRDLASGEYRLQMEAVAGEDTVRARCPGFCIVGLYEHTADKWKFGLV